MDTVGAWTPLMGAGRGAWHSWGICGASVGLGLSPDLAAPWRGQAGLGLSVPSCPLCQGLWAWWAGAAEPRGRSQEVGWRALVALGPTPSLRTDRMGVVVGSAADCLGLTPSLQLSPHPARRPGPTSSSHQLRGDSHWDSWVRPTVHPSSRPRPPGTPSPSPMTRCSVLCQTNPGVISGIS